MLKTHSARTAICIAYSVHLKGQSDFNDGGKVSATSTDKIANIYELAKIISAVESHKENLRSWLKWAYGPAVMITREIVASASSSVVSESAGLPSELTLREQILVMAAMENYRALLITGARKYRKPAHFDVYARRVTGGQIGISNENRNFMRDHGDLLDAVEAACAKLDELALPRVATALHAVHDWQGDDLLSVA